MDASTSTHNDCASGQMPRTTLPEDVEDIDGVEIGMLQPTPALAASTALDTQQFCSPFMSVATTHGDVTAQLKRRLSSPKTASLSKVPRVDLGTSGMLTANLADTSTLSTRALHDKETGGSREDEGVRLWKEALTEKRHEYAKSSRPRFSMLVPWSSALETCSSPVSANSRALSIADVADSDLVLDSDDKLRLPPSPKTILPSRGSSRARRSWQAGLSTPSPSGDSRHLELDQEQDSGDEVSLIKEPRKRRNAQSWPDGFFTSHFSNVERQKLHSDTPASTTFSATDSDAFLTIPEEGSSSFHTPKTLNDLLTSLRGRRNHKKTDSGARPILTARRQVAVNNTILDDDKCASFSPSPDGEESFYFNKEHNRITPSAPPTPRLGNWARFLPLSAAPTPPLPEITLTTPDDCSQLIPAEAFESSFYAKHKVHRGPAAKKPVGPSEIPRASASSSLDVGTAWERLYQLKHKENVRLFKALRDSVRKEQARVDQADRRAQEAETRISELTFEKDHVLSHNAVLRQQIQTDWETIECLREHVRRSKADNGVPDASEDEAHLTSCPVEEMSSRPSSLRSAVNGDGRSGGTYETFDPFGDIAGASPRHSELIPTAPNSPTLHTVGLSSDQEPAGSSENRDAWTTQVPGASSGSGEMVWEEEVVRTGAEGPELPWKCKSKRSKSIEKWLQGH